MAIIRHTDGIAVYDGPDRCPLCGVKLNGLMTHLIWDHDMIDVFTPQGQSECIYRCACGTLGGVKQMLEHIASVDLVIHFAEARLVQ